MGVCGEDQEKRLEGWDSHKEINNPVAEKENARARLTEHRGEGAELNN